MKAWRWALGFACAACGGGTGATADDTAFEAGSPSTARPGPNHGTRDAAAVIVGPGDGTRAPNGNVDAGSAGSLPAEAGGAAPDVAAPPQVSDAGGALPEAGGSTDAMPPSGDASPSGGCSDGGASSPLVGWGSVSGTGVSTTTGGGSGPAVKVSTLTDLNSNAGGTKSRVIQISGTISGNVTVGSNKTLVGGCGATIHGHIQMTGSVNVIVRDLTVVGYNCTDSPSDCSAGADAITVERQAHHLWFDHDDISDGSDGNLDITHASDFITISWTKFHYSGRRTDPAGASGGHQFCNLIGHSDSNASEDTGHLRVTLHHVWWADNVVERMPRVRFGQVHVFDSLYTASGNDYCIGVGANANIRDENNVFLGVKNPIDSTSFANAGSVIQSSGNVYLNTTGTTADVGGSAFVPPYSYVLDPASSVQASVQAGAGPR